MRALLLATALAATPALAKGEGGGIRDGTYHRRPFQLSFFVVAPYLPYYFGTFGVGAAARFTIPLVHQGFIGPINDSFELELGGNFYGSSSGAPYVLTPVAEARWTFHITHHFSAYGKLGFGWHFPIADTRGRVPQPHLSAAVGILFEVVEWFYLRAEAGYPGLLLGIAFAF